MLNDGYALLLKVEADTERKELAVAKDNRVKQILSQSNIVESLVVLLDKYVVMVKKCFQGDVLFERSRQIAFETFLNRDRDIS